MNSTSTSTMGLPIWHIPFVSFAFISAFLYMLIIVIILSRRKSVTYFTGSYFKLTMSQSVAEIAMFLEFLIFYRGRKFGYLDFALKEKSDAWDYVPRISTFFHYYLKIAIYIGQIYFAINRYTAIYKPMNYEKLWTRKRLCLLRALQYSIPICFTAPVAFNYNFEIHYQFYEDQNALRLIQDDYSAALVGYIDGGASFIATVICSILYAFIIVKTSRDMLRYKIEKKRLVEIRLAFCAIFIFIVLLLNNIVQVMTCYAAYFKSQKINLFVNDLSYPIVDFLYSITPWALIFTSAEIQRQLTPCIPRQQSPQTTFIHSSTSRTTINPASATFISVS